MSAKYLLRNCYVAAAFVMFYVVKNDGWISFAAFLTHNQIASLVFRFRDANRRIGASTQRAGNGRHMQWN
jgi:hypothetical protein